MLMLLLELLHHIENISLEASQKVELLDSLHVTSPLFISFVSSAQGKTISMPRNVPDPWHGPFDEYVRCIEFIESQMDDLFATIESRHK
jgi:hypothetical protein